MKTPELLTGSMALGPFLASLLALPDHEFENHGSQNDSDGAPTTDIVLSRDAKNVAEGHSARPRVVTPGPMISGVPTTRRSCAWWGGLRLLMTLCSRRPRRNCPVSRESNLPPGCVLAVRYSSR